MPFDPVCKGFVDLDDAAASDDYQYDTVYFCSHECKEEFQKDPDGYMRTAA